MEYENLPTFLKLTSIFVKKLLRNWREAIKREIKFLIFKFFFKGQCKKLITQITKICLND
jgi:hypothetical protein